MKTFIIALFIVALALPAFALTRKEVAFPNLSTTSGATINSAVIDVRDYRTKTVVMSGVYGDATFGNFSGTGLIQCGATATGPWYTCVQEDSTAISQTAPGILSWRDAVNYIRVAFTKTKHDLKVWFMGLSE